MWLLITIYHIFTLYYFGLLRTGTNTSPAETFEAWTGNGTALLFFPRSQCLRFSLTLSLVKIIPDW